MSTDISNPITSSNPTGSLAAQRLTNEQRMVAQFNETAALPVSPLAAFLSGGAAGSIPYQTAPNTTTFLPLGTSGYVLEAGASAPGWVAQSTLSVGNATNVLTTLTTTNAAHPVVLSASSSTGNESPLMSTAFTFNPTSGAVVTVTGGTMTAFQAIAGAATQCNGWSINQSGQTVWIAYQPASNNDLYFYAGNNYVIFNSAGNVILNGTGSALATSATNGFTFPPTCAGTPTGVPAIAPTGTLPLVINSVTGDLFAFANSAWQPFVRGTKCAGQNMNIASFSTVETYITPQFSIPANTLAVGDTFRFTVYGTCTTTVANTYTFTMRIGTAGTTADAGTVVATGTAASSGSGTSWKLTMEFTVTSTGAGGAGFESIEIGNGGSGTGGLTAQPNIFFNASPSINTTQVNFLGISLKTSAATTTNTVGYAMTEKVR